jgi:ATP-dependent exoDNAse (exonuclease V) alpha subunit
LKPENQDAKFIMSLSEKTPLELSPSFRHALQVLEKARKNVFITGKAGTGKSTLLRLFRATTKKKLVVLAPTGVAALNVQGQTIHSFFGLPPKPVSPAEIKKVRRRKIYQNLEAIVIDEISMVRADLLDAIDRFLRINRENPLPFGGVQMIFFGDLFQLPPVVASDAERFLFSTYYTNPYFFSAKVFEDGFSLENIELHRVYRQESRHFLRLLEAIRLNRIDHDDLDDLNERWEPTFQPQDFYITLSPRNDKVDRINRLELDKLPGRELTYRAEVKGIFEEKLFPAEGNLQLKEGAQVMFVKNDPEKQFVNGTIGKVRSLQADKAVVEVVENGQEQTIEVSPVEWEILRFVPGKEDPNAIDSEVVGTFKQLPLRLAWAITIHKSQGKTFDKVLVDMGSGAFEHGQTYVALSRCRTLEGIVLKQKLRPQDILVDEQVVEYYERNF